MYAYKGTIELYPKRKAIPSMIAIKSTRHSEKPDEIRRMIEPLGDKRIELFARKCVDNWTCIGNEINNKDINQAIKEEIHE